ncbi:MAG: hypothetical protein HQL13_03110 [Candidatus Omnitrophica bacterium]|nr:hypothetical protein [Candidatus Omnitrophota bacterium]
MKKIFLFIFGFILMITPCFAQDRVISADEIVSKMQVKLHLTQDQMTAVKPIIEKFLSKREELKSSMEDGTNDKDKIKGEMKQLRLDEAQELGQVLSAAQLSQWKQMQKSLRQKPPVGNNQSS